MPWFKGNFHCHSNQSDGSMSLTSVAQYYKKLEYDVLGISDHNICSSSSTWAKSADILGISTSEYTGEECCHVVAIGVEEAIAPNYDSDDFRKRSTPSKELLLRVKDNQYLKKIAILQDGIDKTLAAGGIPVVAHPFWNWTLTEKELLELTNFTHFEVCNASPDCNSIPLLNHSYVDELWDELLSADKRVFGLACDDAHSYLIGYNPRSPLGGRGWNIIKAPSLTQENILNALKNGHFIASTGIQFEKYLVTQNEIEVVIDVQHNERLLIEFIGKNGKILQSEEKRELTYKFKGTETYVRVRVSSTGGVWAWTQPVFLDDLEASIKWTQK